jgi:hypothetical protein
MKIRTNIIVGAACLLAVAAIAAQDTFNLSWKPKVGDSHKYKVDVKASMDMGGMMGDLKVGMVQTMKVLKIEDGKVTTENTVGNMTLIVNGEDMSQMMGDQSMNSTTVYGLDGSLISLKSEMGMEGNSIRMENAYSMTYPNKEVKVGDSWSRTVKGNAEGAVDATATFKIDGIETIGTDRCVRIKGDFKETAGQSPMTCKSTMWVRESDGAAVKGTFSMTNVEFQPGMPPVSATATLTKI